jgi:hypothetical protein
VCNPEISDNPIFIALGDSTILYFKVSSSDPTTTMKETNTQHSQQQAHEGLIVETGVSRDILASDLSLRGSAGFGIELFARNVLSKVGWSNQHKSCYCV